MPLDDALLAAYMNTFYGYGSYDGDWWLVGMEEGGGRDVVEVETRLRLWADRGRRELEDVDMFSPFPELAKWFVRRPPLQATWRGLIRMILAAEGRDTGPESARGFQASELGRIGGNTCIVELMPLPSRSVQHWLYAEHSALPELRDRQTYFKTVSPHRVDHLKARIRQRKPRAVIFYSRNYRASWEQLADASFGDGSDPGIHVIRTPDTVFVMTAHPAYRGVTTEYFVRGPGQVIAGFSS